MGELKFLKEVTVFFLVLNWPKVINTNVLCLIVCPCINDMIYHNISYPYQIVVGNDENIIVAKLFNLQSLATTGGGHMD